MAKRVGELQLIQSEVFLVKHEDSRCTEVAAILFAFWHQMLQANFFLKVTALNNNDSSVIHIHDARLVHTLCHLLLNLTFDLVSGKLHDQGVIALWPMEESEVHRVDLTLVELQNTARFLTWRLCFEYKDGALLKANNEFMALWTYPFHS